MSQVKKLENLLSKLEQSRESVRKIAEGGFLGIKKGGSIGHSEIRPENESTHIKVSVTGGKKPVGRPRKMVGGGYMGSRSDKLGQNAQNTGFQPLPEHMGPSMHGGYLSGGKSKSKCGGYLSGGMQTGGYLSGGKSKLVKTTSTNPWIAHVKAYQQKHGCTYKEAMKLAKSSY